MRYDEIAATTMIGEKLGPYQMVEAIRAGGMGEVFRALDTRLHRTVAIKILKPSKHADPNIGLRFQQEARAASALNHPNIVVIYDVSEWNGRPYIVMEFIDGQPLDRMLANGPLDWQTAIKYARQMADALDCAHRARIVHRDLKPANVMITTEGRVKILDFGLAKILDNLTAEADGPTMTASSLAGLQTEHGAVMGTPAYMSPEQVNGQAAGPASDIFSLGVLLWEMVSGKHAFSGPSHGAIMAQVLTVELAPLQNLVSGLPSALSDLVKKCVNKSVHGRIQTLQEIKETLDRLALEPAQPNPAAHYSQILSGANRPVQLPQANPLVAVVPFINANQDPENDYFAAGLAEETTFQLGKIPGLRVMARASSSALRKAEDMLGTAARLGIGYVLDGSVRRQGSRMRVFVQLFRTADGIQLWTERYDREVTDVFSVQDEIALSIAEVLKLRLDASVPLPAAHHRPESITAYQLYLKGRHFWNRRTWQSLRKGIEHFQEAVNNDPLYTLAYVGLADSYNLLGYYAERPPLAAFPAAKAAAQKALELDDDVAEAHASLGYTTLFFDWDWAGAEREFQRAIQLDPGYSSAHQWRAWYLFAMNRLDDSLLELQKAQHLDPLSTIISDHLALGLVLNGKTDEAIQQIKLNLEMDPAFPLSYRRLGLVYYNCGRLEDSEEAMTKAVELSGGTVALGPLGFVYGRRGNVAMAEAIIERLRRTAQERYVSPLELALVNGGLGRLDETFHQFSRAVSDRTSDLVLYHHYPWPEEVRRDPRYAKISREIGFPDLVLSQVLAAAAKA